MGGMEERKRNGDRVVIAALSAADEFFGCGQYDIYSTIRGVDVSPEEGRYLARKWLHPCKEVTWDYDGWRREIYVSGDGAKHIVIRRHYDEA